MFRLIKKYYFKLYHLFKFLGIFILIFGLCKNVKAEECKNILEYQNWLLYREKYFLVNNENHTYYFNLENGKTYTMYLNDGEESPNKYFVDTVTHLDIVSDSNILLYSLYKTTKSKTFEYNGAGRVFIRTRGTSTSTNPFIGEKPTLWLVEGDKVCIPEKEQNEVYSSFLTLYIDRLNYLANRSTNNPYLFAMIGIIFAWVVLELFLKILHLRGGCKK